MFQTFDPSSDRGFAARHLPALRDSLSADGLDGFLIPHDDEYLNEYLPANAERLMWVSGFSGSAGSAIVLAQSAAVFSDGRYTLQLEQQVDSAFFSLHNSAELSPWAWLKAHATPGMVIGYDPMLFSKASLTPFQTVANHVGFRLHAVSANPIDAAWTDRPAAPNAPIVPQPDEFAGRTSEEKRKSLGKQLAAKKAEAALITAPTSLAWLFNIRGGDVHASPLPLGRALLYPDGTATLFINPDKVDDALKAHLGRQVDLAPEAAVESALNTLGKSAARVLLDPTLTPLHFETVLRTAGAQIIEGDDPCALPRATKTTAELEGARTAHVRDGAAVTCFLHWLAETAPTGTVTEISAAQQLEAFRRETGVLKDISFDSISGAGGHGAVVHYRVTTETDQPLKMNELFLIDSGGQYQDGTTDITRTVAVGTPTDEMRRHYTLVLKGHIALATLRFPEGISGHQLDAFARRPLWEAGLDYDHGTGHGVGAYLGVHEGPQNISKKPISQALMTGMICSNEPGFYKTGTYGIRIENLIIVTEPTAIPGGERGMHGFETITLAPLERELINPDLLTADERDWVDQYHAEVAEKLASLLPAPVADWLRTRTAPL